jgi:hypothetical protein
MISRLRAHRAAQYDHLAMQLDNAQVPVGSRIGHAKAHR